MKETNPKTIIDPSGQIWHRSICTCSKSRNGYYKTDAPDCDCQKKANSKFNTK
jgi:hypothetical protein